MVVVLLRQIVPQKRNLKTANELGVKLNIRKSDMLKITKWISLSLLILIIAYISALSFPSFLYAHKYKTDNLIISCDQKLPDNINIISNNVLNRIKKSEYYNASTNYYIYISNGNLLWRFVSNFGPNQGGVTYTWFGANAFIRPSVISEDRIIPPGNGLADAEERDLVYFISHEATHEMMMKSIGAFTFQFKVQNWVKEGYADFIGKQSFDYASNLEQLKRNENRLSESSGLYVRYHLFLIYLFRSENLGMSDVINRNISQEFVLSKIVSKQ